MNEAVEEKPKHLSYQRLVSAAAKFFPSLVRDETDPLGTRRANVGRQIERGGVTYEVMRDGSWRALNKP